jgi:uncharacterized protein YtpQ (UPF0354 family)
MDQPDVTSSNLDRVLPMIRSESFSEEMAETDLVSHRFVADLRVFHVIDQPTMMRHFTNADLAKLAVSPGDLCDHALANLKTKSEKIEILGDGPRMLFLDGVFEVSLLLHSRLWSDLSAKAGQIVLAVLARDLVIFVDGSVAGQVDWLRERAGEEFDNLS